MKTRETTYVLGLLISPALSSMSWSRLFFLLRHFQIPPDVYNVLRSYFQDQEILIRTSECIARKRIKRGCSQGSILGLILWNTYLDNLLSLFDKEEDITDFAADDPCILIGGNSRRN